MVRFESLKEPFNFRAFQANSKKAIRIPHIAIRIHIPESSDWQRRFESTFQKVQTDEGDSNPSWSDSNPNSSKVVEIDQFESPIKRFESLVKKKVKQRAIDSNHPYSDSNHSWKTCRKIEVRIRIPYTTIRILEFGVMKNKARRFEYSSYGFESLSKSEGWRSDRAIWIFELQIQITLWRKIQISLRRFKSPIQRFESFILQKH